jgi:hypothetical protein
VDIVDGLVFLVRGLFVEFFIEALVDGLGLFDQFFYFVCQVLKLFLEDLDFDTICTLVNLGILRTRVILLVVSGQSALVVGDGSVVGNRCLIDILIAGNVHR